MQQAAEMRSTRTRRPVRKIDYIYGNEDEVCLFSLGGRVDVLRERTDFLILRTKNHCLLADHLVLPVNPAETKSHTLL